MTQNAKTFEREKYKNGKIMNIFHSFFFSQQDSSFSI